uniref:Transmembrane protein 138 n=1 Tax=Ascaris lumbricoides TaxID=6252 RepID=A0A0M3IAM7_ASCLU
MLDSSSHLDTVSIHTWKFCPLTNAQLLAATGILMCYSLVYLIYAQHHTVLFYFMTGFIALFMIFLYASGLLAVFYMTIKLGKLNEEVTMRYRSTTVIRHVQPTVVEVKF